MFTVLYPKSHCAVYCILGKGVGGEDVCETGLGLLPMELSGALGWGTIATVPKSPPSNLTVPTPRGPMPLTVLFWNTLLSRRILDFRAC